MIIGNREEREKDLQSLEEPERAKESFVVITNIHPATKLAAVAKALRKQEPGLKGPNGKRLDGSSGLGPIATAIRQCTPFKDKKNWAVVDAYFLSLREEGKVKLKNKQIKAGERYEAKYHTPIVVEPSYVDPSFVPRDPEIPPWD